MRPTGVLRPRRRRRRQRRRRREDCVGADRAVPLAPAVYTRPDHQGRLLHHAPPILSRRCLVHLAHAREVRALLQLPRDPRAGGHHRDSDCSDRPPMSSELAVGQGGDFFPCNGRWNFNNKTLLDPCSVERWAVVNFSAQCNMNFLIRDLIKCGKAKGIMIEDPFEVIEENPSMRRAPPTVRVESMFEQIRQRLPGAPKFLLCLLAERKNSDVYGCKLASMATDFDV